MQERDSSLRQAAFKLSGDCFVDRLFTSSSCLKEKGVGPCNDYAKNGFQCVDADRCNEMCEVIPEFVDGGGSSNPFTVRASQLGCESDKTCSGYNEVCCR